MPLRPGCHPAVGDARPVYDPVTNKPAICVPPCDVCATRYSVVLSGLGGYCERANSDYAPYGSWTLWPVAPLAGTCQYKRVVYSDYPGGVAYDLVIRLQRGDYAGGGWPAWIVIISWEHRTTGRIACSYGAGDSLCEYLFGPVDGVCPPDEATEFPCWCVDSYFWNPCPGGEGCTVSA